jgi:hypothetical protein
MHCQEERWYWIEEPIFWQNIFTHRSLLMLWLKNWVNNVWFSKSPRGELKHRVDNMGHQLLLCFPNNHCYFMEIRAQMILQSFQIISSYTCRHMILDTSISLSLNTSPHWGITYETMDYKVLFKLKIIFNCIFMKKLCNVTSH